MAKKKKNQRPARPARPANPQLRDTLTQVDALCASGQWAKARNQLEGFIEIDTRHPEVFEKLAVVAEALQDDHLLQRSSEKLLSLRPNDKNAPYLLTRAYLGNGYFALALSMSRRALTADPNHPQASGMRKALAELESMVRMEITRLGLDGPDGLDCLTLQDRVRSSLTQWMYDDAHQTALLLLQRRPRFAPAYNNGAEACFHAGKLATAIDLSQRLLAIEPDNIFALANIVRFLVFSGKVADARRHAQHLKAIVPMGLDLAIKQAEALAWLGDDAGVLAVFKHAQQWQGSQQPRDDALLFHLAAVAAYRSGLAKQAHSYWQTALRAVPDFELARDNLDDLSQPVSQRHAPWSYSLPHFVPRQLIDGLVAQISSGKKDSDDNGLREARRYLQAHPELEGLVPLLFDRCDKSGRELAMHLVRLLRTPTLFQAARDFALGQRGPDAMRLAALEWAQQAGLVQPLTTRLWLNGQWREGIPLRYDIHGEPEERPHAPGVADLLSSGLKTLQAGNTTGAEKLFRQALAIDPNDVMVLNNLAAVCGKLGRADESEALIIRLHKIDPDYLFGRIALANLATERGQVDQAKELLSPLLDRSRFHISEFAAFCIAELNLHLATGDRDQAKNWFGMLRSTIPDHPILSGYEEILRR